jgi:hypothetical protein
MLLGIITLTARLALHMCAPQTAEYTFTLVSFDPEPLGSNSKLRASRSGYSLRLRLLQNLSMKPAVLSSAKGTIVDKFGSLAPGKA